MDRDEIENLKKEKDRLVKMICNQERHRIRIKVLVSFGSIEQLDDLITKIKKIRETHYDVEIEVDFRTIEMSTNPEGDRSDC